jgi:hypothetical protein
MQILYLVNKHYSALKNNNSYTDIHSFFYNNRHSSVANLSHRVCSRCRCDVVLSGPMFV